MISISMPERVLLTVWPVNHLTGIGIGLSRLAYPWQRNFYFTIRVVYDILHEGGAFLRCLGASRW